MKKFLSLLAALTITSASAGTTFGTDASDLWWNASESGWGVNVVQQNDTMFLTFFVYGVDNRPVWYTATLNYSSTFDVFTGLLYRTTGPWLGSTFNPNAVGIAQVGTASFKMTFVEAAILSYVVDGVTVNKNLTRQTFKNNPLTGVYTGALQQVQSGCSFPAVAGTYVQPVNVLITHAGTVFGMTVTSSSDRCDYSGTYRQDGRMGRVFPASFSCTSGNRGTTHLFEIEGGISGITGRFSSQSGLCTNVTGRFGIVRN